MRPLLALVIYVVVVFIGGALLAPWLYWLAQAVAADFPRLANAPFHRYVNRSLLMLALAGLWPLLHALGARKAADLGLVKPGGQSRRLVWGFALGFVSLAVVAVVAWLAGARMLADQITMGKLAGRVASAVATAAVVALLEEVLFRGGIFAGLKRVLDWRVATVVSSAVYALMHFLARVEHGGEVGWNSGLVLLPRMLHGFIDWQALLPGFFNLLLAGTLLALALQRTGNLYFSIGLHAGWIFWLKIYGSLTTAVAGANVWLWGTAKLIDGWLALIVLAITVAILPSFSKRPHLPADP